MRILRSVLCTVTLGATVLLTGGPASAAVDDPPAGRVISVPVCPVGYVPVPVPTGFICKDNTVWG